jgi:hypothetical protein
MTGWMILFILMVLFGLLSMLADSATLSARWACSLFGLLFLAAVVTRAARGRAW